MGWRHGQAYSQDLRDRVLGAQGSVADVGKRFGVSASYVSRARWRQRSEGVCSAKPRGGHVPLRLAGLRQQLETHVASHSDATLAQLCQWAAGQGVTVSVAAMHKSLARWGLTLKKRRCTPPSKSART